MYTSYDTSAIPPCPHTLTLSAQKQNKGKHTGCIHQKLQLITPGDHYHYQVPSDYSDKAVNSSRVAREFSESTNPENENFLFTVSREKR